MNKEERDKGYRWNRENEGGRKKERKRDYQVRARVREKESCQFWGKFQMSKLFKKVG